MNSHQPTVDREEKKYTAVEGGTILVKPETAITYTYKSLLTSSVVTLSFSPSHAVN